MKQYQLTKNRSKKQSLKKILFGSVVFVGLSVGSAPNSYAIFGIGDIVSNPTGMVEWIAQKILQGMAYAMQQLQYLLQKLQYALQQLQYEMQKMEYALHLKQYAAQLENLLAVASFLWTRAHDIYNTVNQLDNVHSIYQLVYGSTEALMSNIQSTADFVENPCSAFKPKFGEYLTSSPAFPYRCHYTKTGQASGMPPLTHIASKPISGGGIVVSDVHPSSFYALPQNTPSLLYNITSNANMSANIDAAALNTLQEQAKDSAALTKLNTSEIQFNLQQQSDLQNEAENIDNIQSLKTTGNLQALQKQNQLAGNIATQLMKIHALILARNSAEAQKREEETQEKAKAETFYYQVFLTNSYAPMKKHVWK